MKSHFTFAFCSCLNDIFLLIFQTSWIIIELIKPENKFKRKVIHKQENSENRFSEF